VKPARATQPVLQQAMALHQAGEVERAMEMYRDVLRREPGQADALHLLGAALWQKGELPEAEKLMRRAIGIWGREPGYFADLGGLLNQKGDFGASIAAYKAALKLDPRHANAREGLANCYGRQGFELSKTFQWPEAEAAYNKLLELRPGDAAAFNNLGEIVHHAGERRRAEDYYSRALDVKPDYDIVRFNRGICRLAQENLPGGWADMAASTRDWLPRMDGRKNLPWLKMRLWDGANLNGKKLMIWGDQGIGDEILFASMFPDLIKQGAQITVECTGRLMPLFRRAFPGIAAHSRDELPSYMPDFDYVAPGLWLGRFLRPDFAAFPARRGYLKADAAQVERLRARYRGLGKKRVIGVAWHTTSQGRAGARRLDLLELAQALTRAYPPGETLFVDLQYGNTEAERADVARALPEFQLYHDPEVDQLQDMDIFAAQVAACDEYAGIGNTTAHVAGALGVKGQILIPIAGLTWYWFEKCETCPWYPSLRLLRKEKEGDWGAALGKIAG